MESQQSIIDLVTGPGECTEGHICDAAASNLHFEARRKPKECPVNGHRDHRAGGRGGQVVLCSLLFRSGITY